MSDPPCSSSQLVPARTSGLCRPQGCPAARLISGPGVYRQQTVTQGGACAQPLCAPPSSACLLSLPAGPIAVPSCWELLLLAAYFCEEECQFKDS